jgi:16S rRNA (uracil1498-N3)-methyltransferase
MPYFLSEKKLQIGQPASIIGEEAGHVLLARRAKVGEEIKVQGPDGKRFLATISETKKHEVVVNPQKEIPVPAEPSSKIILFQSVVASGTLDTILQKATELGAAGIVLFNSQYTATKLSQQKFLDKLPRFKKILWEAAKQCERGTVPLLRYLADIKDIESEAAQLDRLVIFDISGGRLGAKGKMLNVGMVIGPEGGLSGDEVRLLSSMPNSQLASLGAFVLKAETAAIAALAVIQQ